jgi:ATP-dependent helicase/nuclease subunit A
MRYTDEQAAAIAARGENLLLSAAAGSGKTATLVERVMQLTMEGADIDTMLVVTFTRAAAAGMREKLTRALADRAAGGDSRAHDQLIRLERAPITTIHAFCAEFLRDNFESADVDPAFTILDDADAKLLEDAALDAALERAYEKGGDDLEKLDYGRGPGAVKEMARQLMGFLESRPDPDAWLSAALSGAPEKWQAELIGAARRAVEEGCIALRQALKLDIPDHYLSAVSVDLERLEDMWSISDYEAMRRAVKGFKLTTPRGRNAGYDPETIEYAKSLRERAKKKLEGVELSGLPLDVALADSMDTLEGARALAEIAADAAAALTAAKDERGALSYGDLEMRTLAALKKPEVMQAAKQRYSYVFVDEYQDTSDIQEAIVRCVAKDDNLFMVGDVKQSIYRFRQAEPRLFLEKYARYASGDGGRLMPLTRNFRSKRSILDFTNAIFERLMTGGDTEIEYDDLAYLRPGDETAEPGLPVEIHLMTGAGEDELTSAEREGLMIAREIKRMMAADESLRFRDFAILTRQGARAFGALMPMLISQGVPCYAEGAGGYFDSLEIRLTLSLLKIIDNFHSDEELIGVLRSCVCGLSVEELAQIRLVDRDVSYADAVLKAAEGEGELAEKLRALLKMLDSWRLRAGVMGLDSLVHAVTDESGLYAYVGALPGGAQRQANIDLFIVRAGNYDRDVSGSLNRFLAFAEGLKARGSGDAAHALGENDDVVHLMTVHHSKGLEFRVVFGARLSARLSREKKEDSMLGHPRLGLGLMRFDPVLRSRRNTLSRAAIAESVNREDLAEELRVLYVLLTRAQERLVLTGSVRDLERSRALWRAAAHSPALMSSMLDMIMASLSEYDLPVDAPAADDMPLARIFTHEAREFAPPALADDNVRIEVDPECYDPELAARYAWVYPHKGAEERPLKLTASGLLRDIDGPANMEALAPRPMFMQEGGMTGAEVGTAYHRAIQLLELRALDGLSGRALIDAIRLQLDSMRAGQLMTAEARAAVRPTLLAAFLDGETGRRMRSAENIRRELPFNVLMPMSHALASGEMRGGDGDILVQGTIDCCFVEDGEWVLLDYKTSRADDLEEVRARYARQLELYAFALERITQIPVKEKILCLISMGREIKL